MSDLIDRQKAITAIFDLCDEMDTENPHVDAIEGVLGNLPPACNETKQQATSSSDCISRQEAIEALGEEPLVWTDSDEELADYNRWEKDVEAIRAVPSAQKTQLSGEDATFDCISRQVAQRLFGKALTFKERIGKLSWTTAEMKQWIADFVEDLPSADRPKGKWLEKEVEDRPIIEQWQSARCSRCGKYHTTPYMYYFDEYAFCPHCGAKMEVEHEAD